VKKTFVAYPYIAWMLLFILLPIIIVVVAAFYSDGVFSVVNFLRCFEPAYLKVFGYSLLTALYCTILCVLLGYPVAYILASKLFKHKNVLLFLIVAPMWMNFLLRTYAWMAILERNGILNNVLSFFNLPQTDLLFSNGALLMGLVYNFLPFMILPIYTSLSKMDKSVIEAARDLGANGFKVFMRVVLPLSLPGVFSGITMVFMPTVTTFVVSRLLGGGQNALIGDIIEYQFSVGNNRAFGAALSLVLMILVLATMSLTSKHEQENAQGGLF